MTSPGQARFTHVNDAFTCAACGREVPPRRRGCRNHCPFCLVSRHVDVFPGDRAHSCRALMDAVGYELDAKKGLVLIFRCRACGSVGRNVAAHEDPDCPDDYERILRLSPRVTGSRIRPT